VLPLGCLPLGREGVTLVTGNSGLPDLFENEDFSRAEKNEKKLS
jgi:hypothetical protein